MQKNDLLTFGLLMATTTAVACGSGPRDNSPNSDATAQLGTANPNLFAIHEQHAIDPADVTIGRLSNQEGPGCVVNAPIHILATGFNESIENGDYVFRPKAGERGAVVLGVLAPDKIASDASEAPSDAFLVVDILRFAHEQIQQSGQVHRLFNLSNKDGEIRLSARHGSYTICPVRNVAVTEDVRAIVSSEMEARAAWLTRLSPDVTTSVDWEALSDPNAHPEDLAMAYEKLGEYGLSGSQLAVAEDERPASYSTVSYTASASRTTWDRCAPLGSGSRFLRCSSGVQVRLREITPKQAAFDLFGPESGKYVRLRINSEPTEAQIYLGAARLGSLTNTSLDVRADDVHHLRLEKVGYLPCPYHQRLIVRVQKATRPIVDLTCRLTPKLKS